MKTLKMVIKKTKLGLLRLSVFAMLVFPFQSFAQVIDAPMPDIKAATGPTMDETKLWLTSKLKLLPIYEDISLHGQGKNLVRGGVFFEDCDYTIVVVKKYKWLDRNVQDTSIVYSYYSGQLEDLLSEELPISATAIPLAAGRSIRAGFHEHEAISDAGEVNSLFSLNESVLKRYVAQTRNVHKITGDLDFYYITDVTERSRVMRAFAHLGRLCSIAAANSKKPKKFVPPPGEPF